MGKEDIRKKVRVIACIGTIALGIGLIIGHIFFIKAVGILGVFALIFGWFVYDHYKTKLGTFISLIVGLSAGIAAYLAVCILVAIFKLIL